MSVIIRLQNLSLAGTSKEIRQLFEGLSIPEGGVHIIGGELGDAFIAFSTDEDARQAMLLDGRQIAGMKIKLFLSSRTEMHKVIEQARQQSLSLQNFMSSVPVTMPPSMMQNTIPQNLVPQEVAKKEEKPSQNTDSKVEKKERRDRSRSHERSRSRDRHDRRSRRRRDRSRSRDRDRRERDRRRRRDRSRSRERTKSRDPDTKRQSNDSSRRKDSVDEGPGSDVVCVGQFAKDKIMRPPIKKAPDNSVWDVSPQTQMQLLASGMLGNNLSTLAQDPGLSQLALNSLGNLGSLIHSAGTLGNTAVPGIQAGNIGNLLAQGNRDARNRSELGNNDLRADLRGDLGRDLNREPWDEHHRDRMDSMRYSGRGRGNVRPFYGGNGNGFRDNSRNVFLSKVQELGNRRNPHAFQSTGSSGFKPFESSDRQSGNSRFNRDNGKNSGTCVELRNVPLNATYQDIHNAFHGLYIRKDGVKMINDNQGNRVGIAYVKFAHPDAKDQAINNSHYIRNSEIEALHLDEAIFQKATDSFTPKMLPQRKDNLLEKPVIQLDEFEEEMGNEGVVDEAISKSNCIVLEDIPHSTKVIEVAKLFADCKIDDLFIMTIQDKKTHKVLVEAYVRFGDSVKMASVMNNNYKLEHKMISLKRISLQYFEDMKRENEKMKKENMESDCISMKGLPFQTTDRDILDFFSDIGVVPIRIHTMLNQMGKPNGECFCEFDTVEEAKRASNKNGLPFGKNMPTIEAVHRETMVESLGMNDSQTYTSNMKQNMKTSPNKSINMLPHANTNAITNTNAVSTSQTNVVSNTDTKMLPTSHATTMANNSNTNNSKTNSSVENTNAPQGSQQHQQQHQQFHGPTLYPSLMEQRARYPMHHPRFGGGFGPRPHPYMPRHPMHFPHREYVESFGKPGCVLNLENVPFKADIEEILKFCSDFKLTFKNVIRRFNELGKPTGEARVSFESPAEAQRALRELNQKKIRDRTIYMTLL